MSKKLHRMSRKGHVLAASVILALLTAISPERLGARAEDWSTDDFFSTDVLQEIRLELNTRDWESLKQNYRENTYYQATLQWRDVYIQNVGIRSRGYGSRNPFKPGLKVDLNRYIPNQEFLGLKSFVLDNHAQDPSMIHERVTMKFFQRMAIPAPRVTHARLYVNDEYAGLYGLVEAIDKDFLRRVFGRDLNGRVENDGYLFEYRYIENEPRFVFQHLGRDLAPYALRFEPRTHEKADPETLYRPLEQMFSGVDFDGAEFEDAMSRYVELPVLMRQLAVENFLADWDGVLGYAGVNNFYLYRFEGRTLSRLIPWDKDFTFFDDRYPIFQGIPENRLAREAMELRAPFDSYVRTLLDAADSAVALEPVEGSETPPAPWLEREIRAVFEQIRDAALEDPHKNFSNDAFLAGVEKVFGFAAIRSRFVRCEVFRAVDPGRVGPECSF